MKKIAYVSLRFTWSPGPYNKLVSQASVIQSEKLPIDFFWISNDNNILKYSNKSNSIKLIHINSNSQIITRIQQIKILKSLLKEYHAIVVRYPLYDPFLHLLLKKENNIIWEHHTKEFDELKNTSKFRYYLEYFRKGLLKKAVGYTSVTEDIMKEESKDYPLETPKIVITNSLDFNSVTLNTNNPLILNQDMIEIVFVASSFKYWHGLSEVLNSILEEQRKDVRLHIVGDVDKKYFEIIKKENDYNVVFHGRLNKKDLEKLYSKCSLGIGSFAFHKIGLTEGATLKVREYLASGLPVYAECKDSGLDSNFKFFKYSKKFSIHDAIEYVQSLQNYKRSDIRNEARKYLDTLSISKKLYTFSLECVNQSNIK